MRKTKITARIVQSLRPEEKRYEVHDQELKGFFVRVQPTGRMNYYQTYFYKRKRQKFHLGDASCLTVAQAKESAIQILADAARGKDPMEERRKLRVPTLREFLDETYSPWVTTHRKQGERTMNYLLSRIYSPFHQKVLSDITPWIVEKWRTERKKAGKAPATINRDFGRLRAALYKAVEWRIIEEHPFSRIKQYREDSLKRVRYLQPEEEKNLREALEFREEEMRKGRDSYNKWRADRNYPLLPNLREFEFSDYLKPMILLSINTGLRKGELLSLHWNEVDLRKKILTVDGAKAKSGKTRHVPLNTEAYQTLDAWKCQTKSKSGMIFESPEGGQFSDIKRSWFRLLKLAKIEDFRWHDLRHHFASRLVMGGVDLNTVRELLGHSDIKMTLRYAHLSPEVKVKAVQVLEKEM